MLVREDGGNAAGQQRSQQEARAGAGLDQTGRQPDAPLRGVFQDVGDRAAHFAAQREALKQPQHNQHNRGGIADLAVGRQKTDPGSRNGHAQHRQGQGLLAPVAVADAAEDHGPQGAHEETHAENGESSQHGQAGFLLGKKSLPDEHGKVPIESEVVPFKSVAENAGDHRLACGGIHCRVSRT